MMNVFYFAILTGHNVQIGSQKKLRFEKFSIFLDYIPVLC